MKEGGIGDEPSNSSKCSEVADGVARKSEGIVQFSFLCSIYMPRCGGNFDRSIIDMQIASIGLDLGKTTLHLVALGPAGQVLVRRKFSQKQLLTYTASLISSLSWDWKLVRGHISWAEPFEHRVMTCG